MSTDCSTGIAIPTLPTDPCKGNQVSANCVIDSNVYTDLGLPANATQVQINQALYLAFKNLHQYNITNP